MSPNTSKGRRNSNERGNSANRRARKLWLLATFGDGVKAPCWECGTPVDFDTIFVDRITPGEQGGRYIRSNIRVHCVGCSGRQGQRRTTEILRREKMRFTTTYDVIIYPVSKRFTCTVCDKRAVRSNTFRQTMNPFNKNSNGNQKTFNEIRLELEAEAAEWQPTMHERCERK